MWYARAPLVFRASCPPYAGHSLMLRTTGGLKPIRPDRNVTGTYCCARSVAPLSVNTCSIRKPKCCASSTNLFVLSSAPRPLGGRGCAPGIISRQGGEMSEKEFAVFLKTIFGLLAEHAISYSRWRRSGCGWRITTRWNNSDRLRRPFALTGIW
jgi:hypothetical protein